MRTDKFRRDQTGQILVIVALMLVPLLGFTGLVADVAWYEVNIMRIQRAADAAALAGVVYLPNNIAGAQNAARQESSKNGFTHGVNGVNVIATPEALNNRILRVDVSSPVRSWFARLFGITQYSASRNARAEFVLPVPMGSPQDYYGINVLCRNSDTPPACPQVASASSGNLTPLGFFGGVEGRGGDRGNGDAYSPRYNPRPTLNAGYDPNGYQYIVEFGPGTVGGAAWVYDPMFCATGAGTSTGRRLGVGDFWFANGGNGFTTTCST
jgi:putative Flp pilus-assembly TadE/G-like protein